MKHFKKNWITLWMIVALLVFLSLGVYVVRAAYLGNSEVKRVVSTKAVSDVVFSSNVMKAPAAPKNLHGDDDTSNFTYPITVCNFDQLSPINHAKENITYTLTARLVRYNGTTYEPVTEVLMNSDETPSPKVFKIQQTGDNNVASTGTDYNLNQLENGTSKVISFTGQTLPGTAPMTDTFTVTFDKEELAREDSEYFIQITATPDENTSVTGTISEISSWVGVSKGKIYGADWSGSIIEGSGDYDAFNMQLTGSGKGTVEIRWDSTYFTVTDMFLFDSSNQFVNESGTAVTGNSAILNCSKGATWRKLILSVDSYTKTNRYEIQFFKTDTKLPSGAAASSYIESGDYVKSE